ncbi:hypothetical protein EYF80_038377 [Liparis tanakae]|uniref:Uncharacterized protein n=1 Tax=Liparis tanakae TaxID=230148 RepID=A0A4Z2GFC1_9TELE|nr:hypothetical protein EYF80_038377 [Liparis tanakae]
MVHVLELQAATRDVLSEGQDEAGSHRKGTGNGQESTERTGTVTTEHHRLKVPPVGILSAAKRNDSSCYSAAALSLSPAASYTTPEQPPSIAPQLYCLANVKFQTALCLGGEDERWAGGL